MQETGIPGNPPIEVPKANGLEMSGNDSGIRPMDIDWYTDTDEAVTSAPESLIPPVVGEKPKGFEESKPAEGPKAVPETSVAVVEPSVVSTSPAEAPPTASVPAASETPSVQTAGEVSKTDVSVEPATESVQPAVEPTVEPAQPAAEPVATAEPANADSGLSDAASVTQIPEETDAQRVTRQKGEDAALTLARKNNLDLSRPDDELIDQITNRNKSGKTTVKPQVRVQLVQQIADARKALTRENAVNAANKKSEAAQQIGSETQSILNARFEQKLQAEKAAGQERGKNEAAKELKDLDIEPVETSSGDVANARAEVRRQADEVDRRITNEIARERQDLESRRVLEGSIPFERSRETNLGLRVENARAQVQTEIAAMQARLSQLAERSKNSARFDRIGKRLSLGAGELAWKVRAKVAERALARATVQREAYERKYPDIINRAGAYNRKESVRKVLAERRSKVGANEPIPMTPEEFDIYNTDFSTEEIARIRRYNQLDATQTKRYTVSQEAVNKVEETHQEMRAEEERYKEVKEEANPEADELKRSINNLRQIDAALELYHDSIHYVGIAQEQNATLTTFAKEQENHIQMLKLYLEEVKNKKGNTIKERLNIAGAINTDQKILDKYKTLMAGNNRVINAVHNPEKMMTIGLENVVDQQNIDSLNAAIKAISETEPVDADRLSFLSSEQQAVMRIAGVLLGERALLNHPELIPVITASTETPVQPNPTEPVVPVEGGETAAVESTIATPVEATPLTIDELNNLAPEALIARAGDLTVEQLNQLSGKRKIVTLLESDSLTPEQVSGLESNGTEAANVQALSSGSREDAERNLKASLEKGESGGGIDRDELPAMAVEAAREGMAIVAEVLPEMANQKVTIKEAQAALQAKAKEQPALAAKAKEAFKTLGALAMLLAMMSSTPTEGH